MNQDVNKEPQLNESTVWKRIVAFLKGRGVTLSPKVYFVDAMSAMALGLFASLLMGTIFGTIRNYVPDGNVIRDFFNLLAGAGGATGAVIGIAVAYSLGAPMLVMLSAGVVGNFGYRENPIANSNFIGDFEIQYLLNKKGTVNLKAYSKTNDRYFSKTNLTTQGAGLLFKFDFNKWRWWKKDDENE